MSAATDLARLRAAAEEVMAAQWKGENEMASALCNLGAVLEATGVWSECSQGHPIRPNAKSCEQDHD